MKLVWSCLLMFKCCSLWHVEMMRRSFIGHQLVRSCLKLFSEMNCQMVVFLGHLMALLFLILNTCLLGTGRIRLQSCCIFWHALLIRQFVHTGKYNEKFVDAVLRDLYSSTITWLMKMNCRTGKICGGLSSQEEFQWLILPKRLLVLFWSIWEHHTIQTILIHKLLVGRLLFSRFWHYWQTRYC